MADAIAWIGSMLLAACAIPQAFKCYKTKSSGDFSIAFLLMWGAGEALLLIYAVHIGEVALVINYLTNLIIVVVILRYLPRREEE
jgi:uncharacterized protein with PQ loop repeat